MGENDPDLLMAICHAAHQRRSQRYSKEMRRKLAIGEILRSESCAKAVTLPCLRMPYLRTGKRATKRTRRAKMETASQARGVPRAIAQLHMVSGLGVQPSHQSHITAIPRQVQ